MADTVAITTHVAFCIDPSGVYNTGILTFFLLHINHPRGSHGSITILLYLQLKGERNGFKSKLILRFE